MKPHDRARPPRETLDEAIDRVAGALTFAAANPTLTARIAERIETASQDARWVPRRRALAFALAGAAAVIVAIVAISTPHRAGDDTRTTPSRATANTGGHINSVASSAAPPHRSPEPEPQTRPRRNRLITHSTEVPQIDALPSPNLLAIEGITPDPLTISPVELAPLDLANLALTESDSADDPKE